MTKTLWDWAGENYNNTNNPISKHLKLLEFIAHQCDNVVEFGSVDGFSTTAFLLAMPKSLISVHTESSPLNDLSIHYWKYFLKSTSDPHLHIGEPDFLFINGGRSGETIERELNKHQQVVKKWIGINGYKKVVENFILCNRQWVKSYSNDDITILCKEIV